MGVQGGTHMWDHNIGKTSTFHCVTRLTAKLVSVNQVSVNQACLLAPHYQAGCSSSCV